MRAVWGWDLLWSAYKTRAFDVIFSFCVTLIGTLNVCIVDGDHKRRGLEFSKDEQTKYERSWLIPRGWGYAEGSLVI